MHSALQVKEIVHVICQHTYTIDTGARHPDFFEAAPSLTRLARVKKGIGIVALDVLWREIPAAALLYLFPLDVTEFNEKGKRASLLPLCNDDWSRFSHYASRIRKIKRLSFYHTSEAEVAFHNLLETLATYRPSLHIIPNLEELGWRSTITEIVKLTIFLVPRLKHVSIESFEDLYHPRKGITPIISGLVNEQTSLRKLHLRGGDSDPHMLPSRLERQLVALLQKIIHLTEVTVAPNRVLMHVLGALPALKILTLMSINNPNTMDSVDNTIAISDTPFHVLESLSVFASFLQLVTNLLTGLQCIPRLVLEIECDKPCTSGEMSSFLELAIDTVRSCRLKTFSFSAPGDEVPQLPAEDFRITLQNLQHLLTCQHLKKFYFWNVFTLDFDDNDLKRLVSAWPKISHLELGFRSRSTPLVPFPLRMTPRGIVHFSACPKLKWLALPFEVPNADCVKSLHLPGPSGSPLKRIDVGSSFIAPNCAIAVACFLIEHFPVLKYLLRSPPREADDNDAMAASKWEEVEAGLKILQDMVGRLTEEEEEEEE